MIESNIMNISVESSEQQPDSENEESQNNLNTNLNNKGYSNVNKIINITHEEPNSKIEEESKNKDSKSLVTYNSSEIQEKNIKLITDGIILFNGKEFKKTTRLNNYVRINKKDIINYKCIYNRREEKFRTQTK